MGDSHTFFKQNKQIINLLRICWVKLVGKQRIHLEFFPIKKWMKQAVKNEVWHMIANKIRMYSSVTSEFDSYKEEKIEVKIFITKSSFLKLIDPCFGFQIHCNGIHETDQRSLQDISYTQYFRH